jgi:hypothetical protein
VWSNPIAYNLHPGYELATIRPEGFEPPVSDIDFFPDGRMVLTTIRFGKTGNMEFREDFYPGKLYLLEGVTGDRNDVTVKTLMTNLYDATGVIVVDDTIFVAIKDALLKVLSLEGDIEYQRNVPDLLGKYTTVATWDVDAGSNCALNGSDPNENYHDYALTPLYKEGRFYVGMSISWPTNCTESPQRNTILEVDRYTGETRIWARGIRTPNGLDWGPEGTILQADNQGNYRPSSALYVLEEDRYYGFAYATHDKTGPEYPPAIWLRHGTASRSPTGTVYAKRGPYKGQVIMGDIGFGGITRSFIEKVNGEWQGCGFLHSGGFEAGIQAVKPYPGGTALFLGGLGVPHLSGWHWERKIFGLQRLNLKDNAQTFEVMAVRSKSGGFEIEYSGEMGESAKDKSKYSVEMWYNEPESSYGGGVQKGTTQLSILNITACGDNRRAYLEISGLKKKEGNKHYVVHLNFNGITSAAGEDLWNREAWYTLNDFGVGESCLEPLGAPVNVMTEHLPGQGIRISWEQPEGAAREIIHYAVYRSDGKEPGITEALEIIDSDIDPGQLENYTYRVSAVSTDMQEGAKSEPQRITSIRDAEVDRGAIQVGLDRSSGPTRLVVRAPVGKPYTVELFDMMARSLALASNSGSSITFMPLGRYAEGVYFVQIKSETKSFIRKIILSR